MHRLATVDTAAVAIWIRAACGLFDLLDELFVNRNDSALRTQLDLSLAVISVGHTATMSLKLAIGYKDHLADKFVAKQSVLVCDRGALGLAALQELSAKDLSLPTVNNENAVRLRELLVPKEEVVSMPVANGAILTALNSFTNFDNLIDSESVS